MLIINLYFLLKNHYIITEKEFNIHKIIKDFKNSDNLPLSLTAKTYKYISNFLNNKYNKNEDEKLNICKHKPKKKIVINAVDLNDPKNDKKWLRKTLKKEFKVKFDSKNPDYLIYNIFGDEHSDSNYNNSIKIATFTENKIPDLHEADYAIGQSHINYLDRFFKYPVFLWDVKDLKSVREKVLNSPMRKKFCGAVISNCNYTDGFRNNFINELNKYKLIDMGGKYKNNIGGLVKNKTQFLSSYKFSLAMENSEGDGYITEKILDYFYSGTIPIYYGDYMVDEFINPKAYIFIRGEKDIKKKIEYIKMIDNDDAIYKNFLKENVLIDDNIYVKAEKELKEFLFHIFEQDKKKAFRKK
jgi:hypothetical protein